MQAENEKGPFAFVIMPFEPEFDGIYSDLIVPALKAVGYDVKRADSVIDQRNILKDIIHSINHADLIVAELTSLNPNVLYELGIAHGLLKPTVMLTQSIEEVPFDLKPYRIIVYSTDYAEVKKLQDQLREIASKHKEGTIGFGNPVSDFAPSVLQHRGTIEHSPEPEEEAEPTEMVEEEKPGWLDFMVEGEGSLQDITKHTQKMTDMSIALSQKITARAAEYESVKRSGVPGSSAKMLKVLKTLASDMIKYAENVEAELPGFHNAWESLEENTMNLISTININIADAKEREEITNVRSSTEKFQAALRQALDSQHSSRETVQQIKGVSKDLNYAVKRITRTIDKLIVELSKGESCLTRIINLIDERLGNEGRESQKIINP